MVIYYLPFGHLDDPVAVIKGILQIVGNQYGCQIELHAYLMGSLHHNFCRAGIKRCGRFVK
jgi:hypothetical protein